MINCKNITKIIKGTAASVSVAAFLGLAACSAQPDPLTANSPDDAGRFLANASQQAENALKLDPDKYGTGGYYGACMDGEINQKNCSKLYAKMLAYAKIQAEFKTLTLRDLTGQQAWQKLRDYYRGYKFDLLPG